MSELFKRVQDSVVVNLNDPMRVELGDRTIEDMFNENYQAQMIRRVAVSDRAARANHICAVCYTRRAQPDKDCCTSCEFVMGAEGYM